MKNRRIFASFMLVFLLLSVFSVGVTASAAYAYDVDFSIKPDKNEVRAGDTFNVDVVITTRKSGYVEFDFELTYDESLVSCELDSFNQDGYIGDGTAEGIFKLTYKDPSNSDTPTPTEKDSDYSVRIAFKAKDVSQKSNAVFKGKINKLSGVNTLDNNKVKALTPATLVAKNVYVLQSLTPIDPDSSETESFESVDEAAGFLETESTVSDFLDTPQQVVEQEKGDDTLKIALIIVGGLVVFGSGFVVGYMVKSKKSNAYSDSAPVSFKDRYDSENDYSGVTNLGSRLYNSSTDSPAASQSTSYAPQASVVRAGSFETTAPLNNTFSPSTMQNTFTGNASPYSLGNQNSASQARSTGTYTGTYAPIGTPISQTQQNRSHVSENTYATSVPKYGTNFEGTYAQYANRQQQMQRTYAQQPGTVNYQNRPMNNAGIGSSYQTNNVSNAYSQQPRPGSFFGNRQQTQQYAQNNANNGNVGRFPTQENTAYPTTMQQGSVNGNTQYAGNNGMQGGYTPSQPSPITGGYTPSTSGSGYNNKPY